MHVKIDDSFTGGRKANGSKSDRERQGHEDYPAARAAEEPPPDDPYADYETPPESKVPDQEPDPAESQPNQEPEGPPYEFTPGGSFILDTDPTPQALWGLGDQVLWADGEALINTGPQGVGKTTLTQQLGLGRCGFEEYAELLGFRIIPGQKRVLYLAMDRPKQIARSFRRMVGEAWRAELDARLVVWQGPPPNDLARYPSLLLKLCNRPTRTR